MGKKLLGKYEIIEEESSLVKIGKYNDCNYRIEIVSKTPQSGQYSEIAKNINSVSHKNISNLKIEEDNSNFYFVDKRQTVSAVARSQSVIAFGSTSWAYHVWSVLMLLQSFHFFRVTKS